MPKKIEQYNMFDTDVNCLLEYMKVQTQLNNMLENLNYGFQHNNIKDILDQITIFITGLKMKIKNNEKNQNMA